MTANYSGNTAAHDLHTRSAVSQANLSQNLPVLKGAAGVVTTRRAGKQVYCQLAIPEVKTA